MRVIGAVIIIITLAVLGQITSRQLLFTLDYVLGGVLAVSFIWARLSLRWLTLERRSVGERAQVGEVFEEVFVLRNRAILPKLWLEIRDESELPGHYPSCVQSIGPLGTVQWRVRTTCGLRGRFRLGPVTVVAGDPFGFFNFQRKFPVTNHLTVYPATFPITRFDVTNSPLPGGSSITRPSHHITPDINGLREYVSGDSLNRIHWASTARHRKLIVKEFEFDPTVDVEILLDMDINQHWLMKHTTNGTTETLPASSGYRTNDSTEEYAVTATATLARFFLEAGRSVGLVAWGQHHETIASDRGERQLVKVMESLASIRAQGQTDFGQLITSELPRLRNTDTIILVTASMDERWLAVVPLLIRKRVKVAVVLVEPQTFGGGESSMITVGTLAAMNIPTFLVKRGDDLSHALDSEIARLLIG